MGIIEIILIAIGLAMDCFAVSICYGLVSAKIRWKLILRMALFFGGFQAGMPVIGWLIGMAFHEMIAQVDHWIAFGLLAAIGLKMIIEGIRNQDGQNCRQYDKWSVLLTLSLATSIDALIVGMSFAMLEVNILLAIAVIGMASFAFTLAGSLAGRRFGRFIGKKAEIVGGVVLVAIGLKILLEHLLGAG